ncbi:MAG: helix-turn-helix domain-containing protein [Calditrichaeota bacterium]|nr:helix-turn-helix domain-containing protein [Calditrichota bacterium]
MLFLANRDQHNGKLQLTIEFASAISFSGFLFCLTAIYFIHNSRLKDPADRHLILLFLVMIVSSLRRFLDTVGILNLESILLIKTHIFLVAPVLFLFIKSSVSAKTAQTRFLYFLPALIYFIITLLFIFTQTEIRVAQAALFLGIADHIGFFVNLAFYIAALLVIHRSQRVKQEGRTTFFMILFAILYFGWFLITVSSFFKIDPVFTITVNYTWAIIPLCAFLYIIFEIQRLKQKEQFVRSVKLNQDEHDRLLKQIQAELVHNRQYEDPFLTKSRFARQLGIKPAYLSFICQNSFRMSFNDYVMDLRLENFIRKVESGEAENLTLFAIAQSSGFQSKATFYKVFKSKYHSTPHQFFSHHLKSS